MDIQPEREKELVLYAADLLGDIAFDGITEMERADVIALNNLCKRRTAHGKMRRSA